jgi:hypothetical protein
MTMATIRLPEAHRERSIVAALLFGWAAREAMSVIQAGLRRTSSLDLAGRLRARGLYDTFCELLIDASESEMNNVGRQITTAAFIDEELNTADAWLALKLSSEPAAVQKILEQAIARLRKNARRLHAADPDPLGSIARWCVGATLDVYHAAGIDVGRRLDAIEIAYRATTGREPVKAIAPWRVAGKAPFPASGPAHLVELTIGARPDEATWACLPYVLMHELVSHVAQGPWDGSCVGPSDVDEFAEGWMDAVALAAHDLAVAGLGVASVDPLEDSDIYVRAAGSRHQRRLEETAGDLSSRHLGMSVAGRVRARLKVAVGDAPGTEQFLAFSLGLNASAAPHDLRRQFVWAVDQAWARPETRDAVIELLASDTARADPVAVATDIAAQADDSL